MSIEFFKYIEFYLAMTRKYQTGGRSPQERRGELCTPGEEISQSVLPGNIIKKDLLSLEFVN